MLLVTATGLAQDPKTLNSFNPGEIFELETYLKRDKVNIVVFWSRHSEPSRRLADSLNELAAKKSGLSVVLIDVDRKGSNEIDWRSPLVRQYNLKSLPYVQITDKEGQIVAEGYEARKKVLVMLDLAGISISR